MESRWYDLVRAVIENDPATACELLERDEFLLVEVRKIVKGQQIDEDVAHDVQVLLLTRWRTISLRLAEDLGSQTMTACIPLLRNRFKKFRLSAKSADVRLPYTIGWGIGW
jgi:hypothetical protein